MATTTNKPTTGAISSALLMLAALLWLTISTPFVYSSRQAVAAENLKKGKAEQQASPLTGASEERSESGINTLSEYMHEHCLICSYGQPLVKYEKGHTASVYISFHPELHAPPPNQGC
jgi:hypothetical protein